MVSKKNKQKIYLGLVLVPFFLLSFFIFHTQLKKEREHLDEHVKWVATIHQKQWDSFINKTVSSITILTLSINTKKASIDDAKELLTKVYHNQNAYGGLLLLNSTGQTVTGTNEVYDQLDVSDKPYIKEVITSKDLVISNEQEVLANGQQILGLASPILNEYNELDGIIVMYLRVDYLSNFMRMLTPNEKVGIYTSSNQKIIGINHFNEKQKNYTYPIDRLPWNISVEVPSPKITSILKQSIGAFCFLFLLLNLLYILLLLYLQRKQAEAEKEQNERQKLDLVGNLAASSAHEIRNPLTGIKGLIQLLSEKHLDEKDQLYFSIIQNEIERINEIVSQFLMIGKPTALKMEKINLSAIIHELLPLIKSEANLYNVICTFHIPDKSIEVEGTADQLKQVLLNIVKNALEAMKLGGELKLVVTLQENQVKLTIEDNGEGIPPNQLKNIFQPFYTSKDDGTGLGLVVCKRIITSFHGEIYITSKECIGTKVDIFFPTYSI